MGLTSDFSWWQLWSCHLAHWDARHLLLNVAAAIPPLLFVRARFLLIAAPILSITLLAFGLDGEYRGASGLIVALWVYAALTRRSGILLAAIAAKLIIEAAGWWPSESTSYTALPLAHYAGAAIGVIATAFARCLRVDAQPGRLRTGRPEACAPSSSNA